MPLGANVRINTQTGVISGIAPAEGTYVVTVCVEEMRNGEVIAMQRKDLQIKIASCTIAAASILPEYSLCGDSKTLSLSNQSTSPLIQSYNWQLTNINGDEIFSSKTSTLSYTFTDTGLYNVKLVINKDAECSDSSNSLVRVYPGFKPDFDFAGSCLNKPTSFMDKTTTVYGRVNSWSWDFGEPLVANDVSQAQNPSYQYKETGTKAVSLIVTNTKGCKDTMDKAVAVLDRPPINLAFHDTLICSKDALQLLASGIGNFSWSPNANIASAQTGSPIVTPKTTTTYFVHLDDDGCTNQDSVLVRVTDRVDLQVMADTTICQGDAVQLTTQSNGFQFAWQPAMGIDNTTTANPIAVVNTTTTYQVTANIGSCTATDGVVIKTVPYPVANAGKDTVICYQSAAQLQGQMVGSSFTWSPLGNSQQGNNLSPVIMPEATTIYTLSVWDTRGCPKPRTDTVVVTVLPPIEAFAGRDTAIVAGQPLQLQASGGIGYLWSPSEDLSANNIPNPIAIFSSPSDGQQLRVLVYDEAGCVDSAFIEIKVFTTMPSVFVPTAFTPNGDGRNDLLKPIAAGMQQIEYFNVYNRWGKLIFTSSKSGVGWDGTINGQRQGSGTYIWVVKAVDYTGQAYLKKGTVTLIR
jgi:gliding motility-associated-like protein